MEDFTTFFAYRIDKEFPFSTFDVTAVESNVKKLTSNVSAVESNVISANAISQTKSILSRKRKKKEMEFDDESGETRCRSIGWLRWSKKGLPKKKLSLAFRQMRRDKSLVATLLYFLMQQCDNKKNATFSHADQPRPSHRK